MRRAGIGSVAVFAACAVLAPAPGAHACPWDADTLQQETTWFPDVLEAIAGAYVHHGPAWYAFRVEDRARRLGLAADLDLATFPAALTAALADGPDAAARRRLADDLVIALDHLGRRAHAEAAARAVLAATPARYEARSNLGVVLAHAGRPAEAATALEAALEVNPDAHFGRMRVHVDVLRYFASLVEDGVLPLPLGARRAEAGGGAGRATGPAHLPAFLAARRTEAGGSVVPLDAIARRRATETVIGMIFAADGREAAHFDALAQLLSDPDRPWGQDAGAEQLAARAYLRAAEAAPTADVAKAYRARAASVAQYQLEVGVGDHDVLTPGELAATYEAERGVGRDTLAGLRADEARILAEAADPEAAFLAAYAGIHEAGFVRAKAPDAPRRDVRRAAPGVAATSRPASPVSPPVAAAGAGALLLLALVGLRGARRRASLPRRRPAGVGRTGRRGGGEGASARPSGTPSPLEPARRAGRADPRVAAAGDAPLPAPPRRRASAPA